MQLSSVLVSASLLVAMGCVATPLREPGDGGAEHEASSVTQDAGGPCRARLGGGCDSTDPNVLCCHVHGVRVDPVGRCRRSAGGEYSYACSQIPNAGRDRVCEYPLSGGTWMAGCFVRREEGRIVEILLVGGGADQAEIDSQGFVACGEELEREIVNYPACAP